MSALDFRRLLKLERESMINDSMKKQPMIHSANDIVDHGASTGTDDDDSGICLNDKDSGNIIYCCDDSRRITLKKDVDCLNCLLITGGIENLFYIPDCIDDNAELQLMELVQHLGKEHNAWHQLRNRRLQCWGHFPELTCSIPQFLQHMIDDLLDIGVFRSDMRPNNVLINEYGPVDGVLHHTDGPMYEDNVAIVSLGSDCIMSFRKKLNSIEIGHEYAGDIYSVVLRRKSLFIFEKDFYNRYMHGIEIDQNIQIIGHHGTCVNRALAQVVDDSEQVTSIHT